jgi:hypothetical protein
MLMNTNRRRMATSSRAIDRSAVFIVPMMNRLSGRLNRSPSLYSGSISALRYSSRK